MDELLLFAASGFRGFAILHALFSTQGLKSTPSRDRTEHKREKLNVRVPVASTIHKQSVA